MYNTWIQSVTQNDKFTLNKLKLNAQFMYNTKMAVLTSTFLPVWNWHDDTIKPQKFSEIIKGKDGGLPYGTVQLLDGCLDPLVIADVGVGLDNVDPEKATQAKSESVKCRIQPTTCSCWGYE